MAIQVFETAGNHVFPSPEMSHFIVLFLSKVFVNNQGDLQIHEPVLATSKALSLINVTRAIYNAYGNKNTPIHIVVPYDDVHEAVYCLLVDLEGIAGVGFDFRSAPGTAGNSMLDVIKKHGFPKVRCIVFLSLISCRVH